MTALPFSAAYSELPAMSENYHGSYMDQGEGFFLREVLYKHEVD